MLMFIQKLKYCQMEQTSVNSTGASLFTPFNSC